MSAYLTAAGYPNISPLLGSVVRRDGAGQDNLLMIAQGYLSNQGDAWAWTQNSLERAIRDELAVAMSEQEQHYNALGELQDFAGLLGQRLGEMHAVLAAKTSNKDFKPETTTAAPPSARPSAHKSNKPRPMATAPNKPAWKKP